MKFADPYRIRVPRLRKCHRELEKPPWRQLLECCGNSVEPAIITDAQSRSAAARPTSPATRRRRPQVVRRVARLLPPLSRIGRRLMIARMSEIPQPASAPTATPDITAVSSIRNDDQPASHGQFRREGWREWLRGQRRRRARRRRSRSRPARRFRQARSARPVRRRHRASREPRVRAGDPVCARRGGSPR